MKKTLLQGLIIIFSFLALWLLLSQVNWLELFNVKESKKNLEEKLGEVFLNVFRKSDREIDNEYLLTSLDSVAVCIYRSNNVENRKIKIHVLENKDVNAFALPGNQIVLYTGLINDVRNQDELIGVICHEMAHIQLGHVMKKLAKETGLSVLLAMVTNGGDPGLIKETAKMLSSTAYDRNLEREADLLAADWMIMAGANPAAFADFLYRMSEPGNEYLTWISTHPDASERAMSILEHTRDFKPASENLIPIETFTRIRQELNADSCML